jgi:hypothetical protein
MSIWYRRTKPTSASRRNLLFDALADSFAESGNFGTDGEDREPIDMDFTLGPKQKYQICRHPVVQYRFSERIAFQAECLTHQPAKPVAPDSRVALVGNRITGTK